MGANLLNELDVSKKKGMGLELDRGALEGLKKMPVDVFEGVYLGEVHENALILCVDLRGFSDYLCSNEDVTVFKLIKEFTSNLLSCINQFGYTCSYYKLLGDGALIIWDDANENYVNAILSLFDAYTEFLNEYLFKASDRLALAGALVMGKVFKYEISAELSELKYRDYVGYGINLASRLQSLAMADQLIIDETIAKTGWIRFRVDQSPETQKILSSLKGLKTEDCDRLLFYDGRKL